MSEYDIMPCVTLYTKNERLGYVYREMFCDKGIFGHKLLFKNKTVENYHHAPKFLKFLYTFSFNKRIYKKFKIAIEAIEKNNIKFMK